MGRNLINRFLISLAVLCLPTVAFGYDEGAYVALNAGVSLPFNDCPPPGQPGTCGLHGGSHAYFVTYGYQYTPMWALEANYGKEGYLSAGGYGVLPLGLTISAVATVHMTDEFSVFGKAGLTYTDLRINATPPATVFPNTSAMSPSGGVGIQYEWTAKMALRFQGDYFGSYSVFAGSPRARMVAATLGLMVMY